MYNRSYGVIILRFVYNKKGCSMEKYVFITTGLVVQAEQFFPEALGNEEPKEYPCGVKVDFSEPYKTNKRWCVEIVNNTNITERVYVRPYDWIIFTIQGFIIAVLSDNAFKVFYQKVPNIVTVSKPITEYSHHGRIVKVREDLKGKHREYCLCHRCKKLNTEDRDNNCNIANTLYALDVLTGLTTPVFECPHFAEKE